MKTVLVVGGSGLIGRSFINKVIDKYKIINLDLKELNIDHPNYSFKKQCGTA